MFLINNVLSFKIPGDFLLKITKLINCYFLYAELSYVLMIDIHYFHKDSALNESNIISIQQLIISTF